MHPGWFCSQYGFSNRKRIQSHNDVMDDSISDSFSTKDRERRLRVVTRHRKQNWDFWQHFPAFSTFFKSSNLCKLDGLFSIFVEIYGTNRLKCLFSLDSSSNVFFISISSQLQIVRLSAVSANKFTSYINLNIPSKMRLDHVSRLYIGRSIRPSQLNFS